MGQAGKSYGGCKHNVGDESIMWDMQANDVGDAGLCGECRQVTWGI